MASATQPTTELPSAQEWKDLLGELLPPQGNWTEEEYLVLTDHRNRLVEFTDGFLEILPMPTDKHQAILGFLYQAGARHGLHRRRFMLMFRAKVCASYSNALTIWRGSRTWARMLPQFVESFTLG